MGLWTWLKNVFRKQKLKQEFQLNIPKIEVTLEAKDKKEALTEANRAVGTLLKHEEYWKEVTRSPKPRPSPKPLGDIRAVRKMKHGHQAPWYRKSVKANIKPEEDD